MLIMEGITFISKKITETSWVRVENERGTNGGAPGQGAVSLSGTCTVGARAIKRGLSAFI